jgi:predicted metal-dependent peptidase
MGGDFDRVLSYIFQNDITINLIQNDTEVKSVELIKNKNELKKVLIKGLGGTTLQPAVDLIAEKYNNFPTVILTDGQTDTLDFSKVKQRVLILSVADFCPISGDNGKIKQIKVEKDAKI